MGSRTLLAFILYFSILLLIGLISHKKQRTSADFIVGNRSLNYWITALSAHASDMSAWLFMALPASVYIGGLSQTWIAIGLTFGMYLNWQLVAKKLRTETEKYNAYTLSSYFSSRFNDNSGIIRFLTASMAVIFLTCYLAAGLIAMGFLLESVFGINYTLGLTVASAVVIAYTFGGGFVTVAWTDCFQALFLLIVIVMIPIVAFGTLPHGYETVEMAIQAKGVSMSLIDDWSLESLLTILFLVFGWGLGYFGQPHIVTKFMGIRDSEEINKAKRLGMTWQIFAMGAACAIGLIGIGFFPKELANPELVFVEMVKTLFNPFVAGFILCGIIAANLSTMDSQILVCASVISEDFYKHLLKSNPSEKALVRTSRVGVVSVALISLFIALQRDSTIRETVFYAWSGLGCCFGPLILMGLYCKAANRYGAIAGILVGGAFAGFWNTVNPYITSLTIPAMIPGFTLSALAIYLVSMATNGVREEAKV